ncbi:hypothetical protein OpiT1DRAFT_00729 [Opitutaceae bacterium TAV1]|nr:hypothetical protein OpiT1DRAFT_00729 [Opitutaceae bacterium TAV1]
MPKGIQLFKEHFSAHTEKYVLIGGSACELALREAEQEFRGTKDLDIVLTLETLDKTFSALFWDFVKAGGYEHQQAGPEGKAQCYRFTKPRHDDYPFMLELFSREPDLLNPPPGRNITRIHADDDASSLSAILMDTDYYALVQAGRRVIDGLSSLNAQSLIPLKAKAWLDLSARKADGERVDTANIRKHKNDVFRLSVLLTEAMRISLPDSIKHDLGQFARRMREDTIDLKLLGIRTCSLSQIMDTLVLVHQL